MTTKKEALGKVWKVVFDSMTKEEQEVIVRFTNKLFFTMVVGGEVLEILKNEKSKKSKKS